MTTRIPLLIDTDPGVDDALAILMALADPSHEVVGLTIAAGNVGLHHTVANALKLCEIAGRSDIPVFAGCPTPLLHAAPDAADVHGADGFGDTGYTPATHSAQDEHAALAILRLSHVHSGQLLLVALGPLTNLALALKLDPALPQRVARLVVMGGAINGRGNITAFAEFNTHFDPEAAKIVFEAFPVTELADWEATMVHPLPHTEFEHWLEEAAASAVGRVYDDISRRTRAWSRERRGDHWHSADALAMAWALEPESATQVEERPLSVNIGAGEGHGMTLVDWQRLSGRPDNGRLLLGYDLARFHQRVRQALVGG